MSLPKRIKLTESENSELVFKESKKLLDMENELCTKLDTLNFTSQLEYIYNPLQYAKDLHETFIKKYFEKSRKTILFLGMNPGPWGMCQNGIFFGEINHVIKWLQITGSVGKPNKEHPKKKVTGLNCQQSERSGKKFWRLFKNLCESPENFFKYSFVYNFCPLAFMDDSGRNITPPEIKTKTTRKLLNDTCEEAFINIIKEFKFEIVIGVGNFAEHSAKKAVKKSGITNIKVLKIPHPSDRNVKNRSNWEKTTLTVLKENGLLKYFHENENVDVNLFLTNKNDSK